MFLLFLALLSVSLGQTGRLYRVTFYKGGDESTPKCVPITEAEIVRRNESACVQV